MDRIPYGKHFLDQEDIDAVSQVLKGDWLTSGPKVKELEETFAKRVGAKYAVAVNSGTAALHLAHLATIQKGDEVISAPMTFVATANASLYVGAKPVFADVDDAGLIDPNEIKKHITAKTKAIVPIHFAGQPCDMDAIQAIAKEHSLIVIEDAAHALGAEYKGNPIGSCSHSDIAIFSLHPVKHITSGEGGVITTNSKTIYEKLKQLRNHGLTYHEDWINDLEELGFNYRIPDFNCALALSQLKKLDQFLEKRSSLAKKYDQAFKNTSISPLPNFPNRKNAYHLYIIRSKKRKELYRYLKTKNIFSQVHYRPVYLHTLYQKKGYQKGLCPNAEKLYEEILSIPLYPSLENQQYVIDTIMGF